MLAIPNETEELARRLARRIGKTPEDVIRDALTASARVYGVTDDETTAADRDAMIAAANEIVRRNQLLPILDARTADEILGYDEFGLPT